MMILPLGPFSDHLAPAFCSLILRFDIEPMSIRTVPFRKLTVQEVGYSDLHPPEREEEDICGLCFGIHFYITHVYLRHRSGHPLHKFERELLHGMLCEVEEEMRAVVDLVIRCIIASLPDKISQQCLGWTMSPL